MQTPPRHRLATSSPADGAIEACTGWETELRRRQQELLRGDFLLREYAPLAGSTEHSHKSARRPRGTDQSQLAPESCCNSLLNKNSHGEASGKDCFVETAGCEKRRALWRADEALADVTSQRQTVPSFESMNAPGPSLSRNWPLESFRLASKRLAKENAPPKATLPQRTLSVPGERNLSRIPNQLTKAEANTQPVTYADEKRKCIIIADKQSPDADSETWNITTHCPSSPLSGDHPLVGADYVEEAPSPMGGAHIVSPQVAEGSPKVAVSKHVDEEARRSSMAAPTPATLGTTTLALEWRSFYRQAQYELRKLALEIEQARNDREQLARDALAIVSGCRQWWHQLESESHALAQARVDLERDTQVFREFTTCMQRDAMRIMQKMEERFHRCVDVWQQEVNRCSQGAFSDSRPHPFQERPTAAAAWQPTSNTSDERLPAGPPPSSAVAARHSGDAANVADLVSSSRHELEQGKRPDPEQRWMRRFAWLHQELLRLRQQLVTDASSSQGQRISVAPTESQLSAAKPICFPISSPGSQRHVRSTNMILSDCDNHSVMDPKGINQNTAFGNDTNLWHPAQHGLEPQKSNGLSAQFARSTVDQMAGSVTSRSSASGKQPTACTAQGTVRDFPAAPKEPQVSVQGSRWGPPVHHDLRSVAAGDSPSAGGFSHHGEISSGKPLSNPSGAFARPPWMAPRLAGDPPGAVAGTTPNGPLEMSSHEAEASAMSNAASETESSHQRLHGLLLYVDSLRQRTTDLVRQSQLTMLLDLLGGLTDPSRSQALALDYATAYIASLMSASLAADP